MMARIIGLTGGIASGKSTMAKFFREKGAAVLNVDAIAHHLSKPKRVLYKIYVQHFGEEILQPDGTLDRRAIGCKVFADETERQWLNDHTHPILAHVTGWDKMTEENCLVFVDEATQLARLMRRNGYTEEEAQGRIAAQMPLSEKKKRADTFIDNSGSLEESFQQAEKLWKEWTHAGIS